MNNQNYVIETIQLTKTYKTQHAIDHVSMHIKKGEIYGLIGKNGAGKTTLIKMITGLIEPTNGEVKVFGSSNKKEHLKHLSRVGSVVESPVAFPNLSAVDNLKYYCKSFGIADTTIIEKTLKKVSLNDTGKKKFKNFSLGMKQRLGIAIALLSQPDFLILDEPINGLDPIGIIDFRELLVTLNKEENITILISSHILSELYHVATCFGFINDGKIIQEVTKAEFDELCNEFIAVTLNDVENAAVALQNRYPDISLKVIDSKTLRIFNHLSEAEDINYYLNHNQIKVSSIYKQGTDLEIYFKELVGGAHHV